MSFYGASFSFDGISCEEYGLMLYDFGSVSQGDSKFAPGMEISEERVRRRLHPLFYGTSYDEPLEFQLVFGAGEYAASRGECLDRQDMERIASWLTGRDGYKWLQIDQPDLAGIRYRCILTDLETIEVGMCKWAFQCSVHCDSPFAYTLPKTFSYDISGTQDVVLRSRSTMNEPYYPQIVVKMNGGNTVSIINHTDGDREFKLTEIPQPQDAVTVDCENGILTASSGLNLYPYFNFKFPRLVRGDNQLTISGNCQVTFTCEFPVNVGG